MGLLFRCYRISRPEIGRLADKISEEGELGTAKNGGITLVVLRSL
jgi:hypothetical protein